MATLLPDVMSDEQLFILIKTESDSRAYAELYQRYWKVLLRFILQHQPNPDEAKDILQDVFLYIWEKRAHVEIRQKVSSFLYRTTLNQVLKKVDRNRFIAAYLERLERTSEKSAIDTEEAIFAKEIQQNLTSALDHMPRKMRLVFEASRFEGLSHEEISSRLGISRETVKSQIKNALRIVRKYVSLSLIMFF